MQETIYGFVHFHLLRCSLCIKVSNPFYPLITSSSRTEPVSFSHLTYPLILLSQSCLEVFGLLTLDLSLIMVNAGLKGMGKAAVDSARVCQN